MKQVTASMHLGFKRANYKAPEGKLVRIALKEKNGIIESCEISGDFFLLPEDKLTDLERSLKGIKLDELAVKRTVAQFFTKTGARGLGVTQEDFVKALLSVKV